MITNIFLEKMRPGCLPVYTRSPEDQRSAFVFDGTLWTPTGQLRLVLPTVIDTDLEESEDVIRNAVASCQDLGPDPGTLIFSLQAADRLEIGDHMGLLLLAGMGYTPEVYGAALTDEDPAQLILDLCRGRLTHPVVVAAIEASGRARQEQNEAYEAERLEYAKVAAVANHRALTLLQSYLTPEQRVELETEKYFHVRAQNGELFRIKTRDHQNVFRVEDGKEVMQYCVIIPGVPTFDLMLAQKFLLETNLEEFMRLANKWDLRGVVRQRHWLDHARDAIIAEEDARFLEAINGIQDAA